MEGYWVYEWDDETSMYDSKGRWSPGIECYTRTYKVQIPNHIVEDEDVQKYIEDNYEDLIWVD